MDSLAFSPRSENYSLYFEVMKFSLQRFDENGNGILDGQETVNWYGELEQMFASFHFSEKALLALKRAWTDSEMDGDNNTGTKAELAQFIIRFWNTK